VAKFFLTFLAYQKFATYSIQKLIPHSKKKLFKKLAFFRVANLGEAAPFSR
jgi:hypothetical protein